MGSDRESQPGRTGLLSAHGASTVARLGPGEDKPSLQTSVPEALEAYYRMWLQTDFSQEARRANIKTPFLVIGGRQDLPGLQEPHLKRTFGEWYPKVEFAFVTDAGHYPMQEAPIYLATILDEMVTVARSSP